MEPESPMDSSPPPERMVTRGAASQQYGQISAGDSTLNSSADSTGYAASQNLSSDDQDEIHSEFHLDSSADSLFRTPLATTRGRKRRLPNDDTPSVSDAANRRNVRGRNAGKSKGGIVRRSASLQEAADESSLFSMVKSGKNLHEVTDRWIEEYERHYENALVQLQQFFISCCGCKGVISSVMLQTMEYSEIIRRMTEQFDEVSCDYPLIMSGPQWKKFKQNFADFVLLLVSKCKSSYVFDQRLMDSVIQLLTGLADSQVRAFRHTATFAAMKLSSALVDIALELVSLKEKNAKQVETERVKLKARGGNDQLEMLINKKSEIDGKTEDVRLMLEYIFKSVFVHRYRDILADIRSICINELGQWMQVYPEHFLEDAYLKYIGWTLYDKVSDVRLKCIMALLPLYERLDMVYKLELFTNKFKDRLVSMVMDKDNEVAMRACQLLTAVYRVFPKVLELKDCVPIYELVYCNHRGVAQAAGEFLNTKVFQHPQRIPGSSAVRTHKNAQLIQDLVQFYMEGDCHQHPAYLVDALFDTNPMMKDYKTMVDMLLSGEADRYDSQLIEVLECVVKQSATGENPVGRGPLIKRGTVTGKEQKVINEDKIRLTEVLIPQLPLLLYRFIADRDKVANLVSIARYFQLDIYQAGRLEKYLDELMDVLESVVEKHADDEVLQNVAEVLAYFSTNSAVSQHIETHRLKILDGLALQFRYSIQRFHREQSLDDEDDAAMLSIFRKITAFAMFEDLKKWQLWEPAISVLNCSDEKQASRDVCEKAVLLLFSTLNWELHRLLNEEESNKTEALKKLKKHRDQFIQVVGGILSSGASGVENAFLCLADMLLLFSGLEDKSLEPVLSKDIVRGMSIFVIDNVFVDEDSSNDETVNQQCQIELKHKRRNLLTQYCKLILHGVLEISDASLVFRFYTKFYTDFGDIIRMLLVKCRELDKLACARAIVSSLCYNYEDLRKVAKDEYLDPNSEEFSTVRDLAKRFATAFGPDPVRNREAIAVIHRDGIVFSLDGKNGAKLTFLEILIEFSGRLMRQDKQSVLKYLEKHGAEVAIEEPFVLYKASLQERNDETASIRSVSVRGRSRVRMRGRGSPTPTNLEE
uniref:SCD domain-containing protein n=1 Tax=Syphacia muris TaxID=451379 RepID=A0A0N5AWQ1_9BILA